MLLETAPKQGKDMEKSDVVSDSDAESSDGPSRPELGGGSWPPKPGPGPANGVPMDKDGRPIYTS